MGLRFSIGAKISTGFGILILSVIIAFYITYRTLNAGIKVSDEVTKVSFPSLDLLNELKLDLIRSKRLIFIWATVQSSSDDPNKKKLKRIIKHKYPTIKKKILRLSENWDEKNRNKLKQVFKDIHQLFKYHKEVMVALPDFESYNEPRNRILTSLMVGEDGNLSRKSQDVTFDLDLLIANRQYESDKQTKLMLDEFSSLKILLRNLGIALLIAGILIAVLTTRMITTPVNRLRNVLLRLSTGVFPERDIIESNDEIGEMTGALNKVVDGLRGTKDFATAVGAGKFDTNYTPLSDDDELGQVLLKMREDLKENERILEKKVTERTIEVVKQKEEIEMQNERISDLYREVTDSIKYAKGLQESILPPDDFISKVMPKSFILYRPKDIVSGDFYWVEQKNEKVYFAAVDCTGHGVPGAFMSIIGNNALKGALEKNDDPAAILDAVNRNISKSLHNNTESSTKDGMDLALCCYNKETKELQYAGAYNPLYIVRDGELIQIKADKFAIGSFDVNQKKYKNHVVQLKENDHVYVFSDGYADQFGGPAGKKFMYHQFRELLLKLQGNNMKDQKQILDVTMKEWKGDLDQVDDILVIGMKV